MASHDIHYDASETKLSREETVDLSSDLESRSIDQPYSIFTKWQKSWICIATSIAAMFSTLSSYIYYPALPLVSKDLGVSISLVNLTVTSYLVVAGIAPSFMGDLADSSGRRPAYMLMFALMLSANIGIAVQKTYAGLLALRMVQSAGSSGMMHDKYPLPNIVLTDFVSRTLRDCVWRRR